MSNSSLINYTKISPNKHHPRNHKIDTITIHHMAGNLTVERCGEIFQKTSREASSNYGIGTDGRIALYVDEEDRAWTSGSYLNDHRAITIEVANDSLEPNWHVSDAALESLINLVVDICKRNDIKKLTWSNDKNERIGHKNGCNMTVHRDFQATACPGLYLYNKMSYIANSVNSKLNEVEEDDNMTYDTFKSYMDRYVSELGNLPADEWAEPAIEAVKEAGVMVGGPSGKFRAQSYVKREELASVIAALPKELQVKITL